MRRRPTKQLVTAAFDIVRTVGLALPDVEATTNYDGSPVLQVDGIFMAGLATHPSAESETLVVRPGLRNAKGSWRMRPRRLPHGLLSKLSLWCWSICRASNQPLLRDLLSVSWRMTKAKSRKRRPPPALGE